MKQEEYDQDKEFYQKILARTFVKRGACRSWLSDYKGALEDFEKIVQTETYCQVLGDKEIERIKKDVEKVAARRESQELKFQGDTKFYDENIDIALAKYQEALEVDPVNEYALGNIGLIYMKKGDHD